jgi:proteasome assembly chaperone (PAC2) family protein
LLHNKNANKIAIDEDGIFKFNDKKGNVLYYQDKIFKKVEWLALVIIGNKGLIFVVNRNGKKTVTRSAWMVNQNGYVDNAKANMLVRNGLIHTTDITVNDETFEATCTVGGLKIHKTLKRTNRYVPVLFLDTLKVSTIE